MLYHNTILERCHACDKTEVFSVANFALLRVILIDSLASGRIVKMPVSGGSVLMGRNGRGKTSMIQLLQLFYGESPSKIASSGAGKLNFSGYYLPRSTSYIVFEYQRGPGELRQVVVHSSANGEGIRYRFVRQGYQPEQYIHDAILCEALIS